MAELLAPPFGDAWVCVARAGRDAVMPTVRGTYNAYGKYARLDIVEFHGSSFVARRDNPGICPDEGWQLLAARGRTGDKGRPGPRGEKGMKGDKGDPALEIADWHIDPSGRVGGTGGSVAAGVREGDLDPLQIGGGAGRGGGVGKAAPTGAGRVACQAGSDVCRAGDGANAVLAALEAMMARLSPLQRGYLLGVRRAKARAQRERDELADRFEETLAEIHAQMRSIRNEMARSRTIDSALLAERDPHMWLN